MCVFNEPVRNVRQTRILVAPTSAGRQVTVYENFVGTTASDQATSGPSNAMLLPCPLREGAAVQLLDLSKDGFSFPLLEACFPVYKHPPGCGCGIGCGSVMVDEDYRSPYLAVHDVGAYRVSVAPSLLDLRRIDPSLFKVSATVEKLFEADYSSGFAFIVCLFDPTKSIAPHPIAYVHDRLPSGLFVPCRHEHGHEIDMELFDHRIFSLETTALGEAGPTPQELTAAYEIRARDGGGSCRRPKQLLSSAIERSSALKALIAAPTSIRRSVLEGRHPNCDLTFTLTVDSV